MPDHPSNPIPAFNEFYSTNFEDLLLFFNALLANNGVFAILRPFWNKHYNNTLLKATACELQVPPLYFRRYCMSNSGDFDFEEAPRKKIL